MAKDTVTHNTSRTLRAAESLSADRREGRSARSRAQRSTARARFDAYLALTKPRVIELLLVATLPVMFLASRGVPDWRLALVTLIGGFLEAGSANTFNCVIDADIDQKMRRTRRRPMPRHVVAPRNAVVFGVLLGLVGTLLLGLGANWLSAGLAVGATLFYVLLSSMVLKRRTWQNTIWGGIAGCFPPLIGWTAVTGRVSWEPLVLFALVFFWTPPHTWALGLRYREDYAAGGVPMLPVVRDAVPVCVQILVYTVVTVATSLVLWPVAPMNWLYPAVCLVAGAVFIAEAVQLLRRARAGLRDAQLKPMRLFHWSNTYLSLVFLAVAIDPLLP
ncbi:MAG: heme o synthase [Acidipropionibacterium jensenii]|nr:heme o synthase [Acidipropionibacterium jensenii]